MMATTTNKTQLLGGDGEAWHYPGFLSHAQQLDLLTWTINHINWHQPDLKLFGRIVKTPRLVAWFGDRAYSYSGTRHEKAPWPERILLLKKRVEAATFSEFNTVLLNYYRHGDDGMGWHADQEKPLGENPVIASLSLGSPRRFMMRHRKKTYPKVEIRLGNGDLLLMAGTMQHHWQHSIAKTSRPVSARVNLTFRKVLWEG